MKKKLLALICALAPSVQPCGLHHFRPDTVGNIGDFEITSGMYLLAQYGAYQQAAQLAGTDQDTTDVKSLPEGRPSPPTPTAARPLWSATTWPRKRRKHWKRWPLWMPASRHWAVRMTDEQLSTADRYAQQMMDQYGDTYTANGIGLETVKAYERLQVEHTAPAGYGLRPGRRDPSGGRRADQPSGRQHV